MPLERNAQRRRFLDGLRECLDLLAVAGVMRCTAAAEADALEDAGVKVGRNSVEVADLITSLE